MLCWNPMAKTCSVIWRPFKAVCLYWRSVKLSFNTSSFLYATQLGYAIFSNVYFFSSNFHFYFNVVITFTRRLVRMSLSPSPLPAFQYLDIHTLFSLLLLLNYVCFLPLDSTSNFLFLCPFQVNALAM